MLESDSSNFYHVLKCSFVFVNETGAKVLMSNYYKRPEPSGVHHTAVLVTFVCHVKTECGR